MVQNNEVCRTESSSVQVQLSRLYCWSWRLKEFLNFFSELAQTMCYNRTSTQPFHLHFTGCGDIDPKMWWKVNPKIRDSPDDVPEVYTEKSYLDIFPPEKIVYLSPDSK